MCLDGGTSAQADNCVTIILLLLWLIMACGQTLPGVSKVQNYFKQTKCGVMGAYCLSSGIV